MSEWVQFQNQYGRLNRLICFPNQKQTIYSEAKSIEAKVFKLIFVVVGFLFHWSRFCSFYFFFAFIRIAHINWTLNGFQTFSDANTKCNERIRRKEKGITYTICCRFLLMFFVFFFQFSKHQAVRKHFSCGFTLNQMVVDSLSLYFCSNFIEITVLLCKV